MEKKSQKRRKYARKLRGQAILGHLMQIRNWQTNSSFLALLSRFQGKSTIADACGSGSPFEEKIEMLLTALGSLSEICDCWTRDPQEWSPPADFSFRNHLSSLIRHLLARSDVPRFMDYVWWTNDGAARQHRKWYRHLANGNSIRGIQAARIENRRQEQRFLSAPDHYSIERALLASRLGLPTERKSRSSCLSRRRLKQCLTKKNPPRWKRIGVKDFLDLSDRNGQLRLWQIRQVRCPAKLIEEGISMQHCVGSYRSLCESGKTTIWSMTRKDLDQSEPIATRALTIEVLADRKINEALGLKNRQPLQEEIEVLKHWAEKESLTFQKFLALRLRNRQ